MALRRTKCRSQVDPQMIDKLISRNGLSKLGMSKGIYGGTCPFCGRERSFTLWSDSGIYRCYWCGCDGRFVMTPERMAEERQKFRDYLATAEV